MRISRRSAARSFEPTPRCIARSAGTAARSLRSCERSLPSPSSRSSRRSRASSGRLAESFDAADASVLGRAALASVEPAEWADSHVPLSPLGAASRVRVEHGRGLESPVRGRDAPRARALGRRRRVAHLAATISRTTFAHSMPWRSPRSTPRSRDATSLEICDALAQHLPEDEVPLRAASLIATWLDGGLLAGLAR